jgi:hypothetical protein
MQKLIAQNKIFTGVFFLLLLLGLWFCLSSFSISNAFFISPKNSRPVDFPLIDQNLEPGQNFIVGLNLCKDFWTSPNFKIISNACFMEVIANDESVLTSDKEKCQGQIEIALPQSKNKIELAMRQTEDYAYIQIYSSEDNFTRNNLYLILLALFLYLWKFKNSENKLIKLFLFLLLGNILFELFAMLKYELYHLQYWDAFVYSAVGRGILNGISPYSEMFDIKPPGIYLLTALSHYLSDGLLLANLYQILSLLIIAGIPITAYFRFAQNRSAELLFASAFLSLLLALYAGERSGGVQTESLGAALGCIAVFAFASPDFDKNKKLYLGLAVLGLLGACGFKEPFLFSLLGCSLLFLDSFKETVKKFILPLCLAIAIGFIIILATGILDGFISYLQYMSSAHINRYGSPYLRGVQVFKLFQDLNNYAWGLGYLFACLLFSPFAFCKENLITKAFLFLSGLLLASFTVGLGGEYYDHHYVFAVPFYAALWLYFLRNNISRKHSIFILIILAISALNITKNDWPSKTNYAQYHNKFSELEANYIDSVLSRENLDRYLPLSLTNQFGIWGYTKHSPQGPYFIQDSRFMKDIPQLKYSVLAELKNAQIIVDGDVSFWPEPQKSEAEKFLQENFSLEPWNSVKDIYRPVYKNKIYFRNR